MDFLIWFLAEGLLQLISTLFFFPAPSQSDRSQDPRAARASSHAAAAPAGRSYREWEEIHRPPAPGALERRWATEFEVLLGKGTRCLVCGDSLESDLVSCTACATLHHQDCWDYARGCSTYGCRRDAGLRRLRRRSRT